MIHESSVVFVILLHFYLQNRGECPPPDRAYACKPQGASILISPYANSLESARPIDKSVSLATTLQNHDLEVACHIPLLGSCLFGFDA